MRAVWAVSIIASILILGTISGVIVFADDDELSTLSCQIGQVMTGILFEDDDEIIDVICEAQVEGPPGTQGEQGIKGDSCSVSQDPNTGDITIACEDGTSVTFNPGEQVPSCQDQGHITNADGTCTAVISGILKKAEVTGMTGTACSTTGLRISGDSKVRVLPSASAGNCHLLVFEWNVLDIPDGSIIIDVDFAWNNGNLINGRACDFTSVNNITQPTTRPNDPQNAIELFNEILNGNKYVAGTGECIPIGDHTIDLGPDAVTDLQNQLDDDWFAVGARFSNMVRDGPQHLVGIDKPLNLTVVYSLPII